MKKEITTKDLMALNELMTFENWIAIKMKLYSEHSTDKSMKSLFKSMADEHLENHCKLLNYLQANSMQEGGK